ncbi:MAG: amidohydrolase [Rubrivivax sp.]|nr:amidohydrolase [Rubrivivax sp.]
MPSQPLPTNSLAADIDRAAAELTPQLIAWRRDIHQHPELSNREFRTSELVANHLRSLGLDEVRTGVAHTGVVGLLKGAKPGPVVALRADMDALPVTEQVDVPFASQARGEYNGEAVGVMHACGHDTHTAILMTVASVLAGLRSRLAGSVKFIFQPAEEGAPEGERGGAALMIEEGALKNPEPDVIFGLHVTSMLPSHVVGVRGGPLMASADQFRIQVRGRQTHGAAPWRGVDPIVTASQVVLGLQTIVSRQIDLTHEPAVVTVGAIRGGVRNNIVPDEVNMVGTIRTFDEAMRDQIHARVRETAEGIAKSARADCEVCIRRGYDVTVNDTALTALMRPTLERVAGAGRMPPMPKVTGSEDFSCFQQVVPGMFFFLGVTPPEKDARTAEPNHSPRFFADEAPLPLGVRALAHLACDWLEAPEPARRLE